MSGTIRVSDVVRDRLDAQKHQEESYDQVLRRLLGISPQEIRELAVYLPEPLASAINIIAEEYLEDAFDYVTVFKDDEDKRVLTLISEETEMRILQIAVYFPAANRQTHRVDFLYLSPQGEMKLGGRLRSGNGNSLAAKYRDSDTLELNETTLDPSDAAERVGKPLSELAKHAYEQWGKEPQQFTTG